MANANPASQAEEPTTTTNEAPVAAPKGKKAEKPAGPKIEYFGEGAEEVKFEVDPKAVLIRVYGSGIVLTDY